MQLIGQYIVTLTRFDGSTDEYVLVTKTYAEGFANQQVKQGGAEVAKVCQILTVYTYNREVNVSQSLI